jgi:hypothetical protein
MLTPVPCRRDQELCPVAAHPNDQTPLGIDRLAVQCRRARRAIAGTPGQRLAWMLTRATCRCFKVSLFCRV